MTDRLKQAQRLDQRGKRLTHQGHYVQAETAHRRALEIREHELGPEHPKTLASLHNLVGVCLDLARYAEAETLYQQVLATEQRIGMDETLMHAQTLNNLVL